jgi:transposase-like protein
MTISFARHQFPPEIIRHAAWLYVRFPLSYRDVEDLLAERGLDVSYETVRRWVLKFGPLFARELRRQRPRPTSTWHLDEMAVVMALSTPLSACDLSQVWLASSMQKISYDGYRFTPEIIRQAIWLYLRFTLTLRDVEDLLAERGIIVSYETVRRWVNHFGPRIAAELRKRRPRPHASWYLDEMYLKIAGRMVYHAQASEEIRLRSQ